MVEEWNPDPLDDVPNILRGMTELAARNTGTKTVITYADCVVLEAVGEIILALGHSTDKDADALLGSQVCNIVADPHDLSVET